MTASPSFVGLLNNEFAHKRPSYTPDGMGGSTATYTTVGTIKGRLRPLTRREMAEVMTASRLDDDFSHILYVTAEHTIQDNDVFEFRGETYRVIRVVEPSYMGHHLQIGLKREI